MPSWARMLVLAVAALVVVLTPRSAFAAAPLCDDRGAIMLAPPPTLDAPVASIDVGMATDRCLGDQANLAAGYEEGNGSNPGPQPAPGETIVPPVRVGVPPCPASFSGVREESTVRRPGVRLRLERPPRA